MKSITVLESDVHATVARVKPEIQTIRQRATEEQRAETADERATIDRLLREAETAKTQLDRRRSDDAIGERIAALTPATVPGGHSHGPVILASIGEQCAASEAYRYVQQTRGSRPERWQRPSGELQWPNAGLYAATLTEDAASGGKLVVSDHRPGIRSLPFRRLVVADLIAPGTTDSNLVTCMAEKTFTNAADTVAEGAAKPESTLTFDAVSDPVRKIAHWLPVTEEMLEDASFIRSYLDARLRFGVQLSEDDQLLTARRPRPTSSA